MKAKELMIEDWVSHKDVFQKVVGIDAMPAERVTLLDGQDFVGRYGTDEIEPVPLTHEIVRSNGFELCEVGDNGPATPRKNLNRYEKWMYKTTWHDIVLWYDRMTKHWCLHGLNAVRLDKVHELQHALRFCGIQQEIKIKP